LQNPPGLPLFVEEFTRAFCLLELITGSGASDISISEELTPAFVYPASLSDPPFSGGVGFFGAGLLAEVLLFLTLGEAASSPSAALPERLSVLSFD